MVQMYYKVSKQDMYFINFLHISTEAPRDVSMNMLLYSRMVSNVGYLSLYYSHFTLLVLLNNDSLADWRCSWQSAHEKALSNSITALLLYLMSIRLSDFVGTFPSIP